MDTPNGYTLVPTEASLELIAELGFNGDMDLAIGYAAICDDVKQECELYVKVAGELAAKELAE